ncbi:MAG: SIS domain-containing protein [Candidatus Aenigmarchaeota archaeon]|nr:SIS domain-containing protein [Candidatus Aenigmarchaeota archaeon]
MENLKKRYSEYTKVRETFEEAGVLDQVAKALELTANVFRSGGTVYFCGNGGSAADSQHFAGEFRDTKPYGDVTFRSLSLTDAPSVTAISNDYGDQHAFEYQLRTMGKLGDLVYGISTSGKAVNVRRVLDIAKEMGIYRIGIVGNGELHHEIVSRSDIAIVIPSADTQQVQIGYFEMLHWLWLGIKDVFEMEIKNKQVV